MSVKPESELYFYARVGNRDGLSQAIATELHDQWEYKFPNDEKGKPKGKQRIRATTIDGQVRYEETIKTPVDLGKHMAANLEATTVIDEAYFNAWKQALGTTGCVKQRYTFLSRDVVLTTTEGQAVKLPEVKYEVDVLIDPQGNSSKWCKIDVEIDPILDYLAEHHADITSFDAMVKLSHLPFEPQDAFVGNTEDPKEQEAIKAFWSKFAHTVNDSDEH